MRSFALRPQRVDVPAAAVIPGNVFRRGNGFEMVSALVVEI